MGGFVYILRRFSGRRIVFLFLFMVFLPCLLRYLIGIHFGV